MISLLFINILKLIAIAIGAGASTVLIAQSLVAAKDDRISKDEQSLIAVVMLLIRMAILLLFITQAWITAAIYTDFFIHLTAFAAANSLTWTLLGVLFITFVFIDYRIISRQLGTSIQLATWYALVFVWGWPLLVPLSIDAFLLAYILFVILTIYIFKKAHHMVGSAQFLHKKSKV